MTIEEKVSNIRKALLDIKEVFNTETGKHVLELIRQRSKLTIQQGVKTHEQYAYLQGMQDLYLWLCNIVAMTGGELDEYCEKVRKSIEREEPLED